MTSALILAGGILACTLVGVFMVWDTHVQTRKAERLVKVTMWRIDRLADFPPVSLDEAYGAAIGHTLLRANAVTADQLADALMATRKPRVFEVVA